jgi:hypothetical protein
MHVEERNLLNASEFGFRARHSTSFQCFQSIDLNVVMRPGGPRYQDGLTIRLNKL